MPRAAQALVRGAGRDHGGHRNPITGRQSMSWQCLPHCRGEGALLARKVRAARVDSSQRGAFACFAILLRHLRIERLSARVAVRSYLTPTRHRCARCGVLRLRACNALEATMKHFKVAATLVNLAIISCGISCSSIPPSPTKSRNV